MTLLGIDAGTTGCKVALFSTNGEILASAYREYDPCSPQPGWAELDAAGIWEAVKNAIQQVTASTNTEILALSVSSLGESVVPVSSDRRILGPSLLNWDMRGEEFLGCLSASLSDRDLYAINGNTLGNHYTLTKLMWIRAHQPRLYDSTDKFLHWSAFIATMLGADPAVDFSLANRSLLFDLHARDWSQALLDAAGLARDKLPAVVPSGTVIGTVSGRIASELGLPLGCKIVAGAHDQCANAVGAGVIDPGSAVFGMGTYHCITPVFSAQPDPLVMMSRGLNSEHHAVPGRFVTFIYNQGGSLVKWFRDTFAAAEHHQAQAAGRSIYPTLLSEMPPGPSRLMVLPHFATTGPPDFIPDSSGLIAGLRLETQRGEILKSLIEGVAFYLRAVVETLPESGIRTEDYRVVGGGSQSDTWVQICADIFGQPITRPAITEAGALGAAIIAGVGAGVFDSYAQGVAQMVHLDHTFEPDLETHQRYQARFEHYQRLWPLVADYLRKPPP